MAPYGVIYISLRSGRSSIIANLREEGIWPERVGQAVRAHAAG